MTIHSSRFPRRDFLVGIAASAAAAILAACGGNTATDTPKPAGTTGAAPTTVGAAPTTAAAAAAATRPAGSVAAASTATPAGSATAVASSGPIGTFPLISADKYKGLKLATITRQEFFPDTQKAMDTELQVYAKQSGFEVVNDHVSTNDGAAVAKQDAAVKSGTSPDMQYVDRFVSQFAQLGDIIDVSDVVEEMQKVYGPVEG